MDINMDANMNPVVITLPQPLPPLTALAEGIRRALRRWPALIIMLFGTWLSAGLLALLPALDLLNVARSPVFTRAAAGIPSWMIVDLLGMTGGQNSSLGQVGGGSLVFILLAVFLMPLVGGLVSAFLYGGVLTIYKEDAPYSLRHFLGGCWRWFGAYLGLALIQALAFFALYLPYASLVGFLVRLGPVGIWGAVILTLLVIVLWVALFELARVRLVLEGMRNPFRAIGHAVRDLTGRPLPLLVFYLAALLLLLAAHAIFRLGINPRVPLDALLLAAAVQQAFILLRLFCQALRLAGLVVLLK